MAIWYALDDDSNRNIKIDYYPNHNQVSIDIIDEDGTKHVEFTLEKFIAYMETVIHNLIKFSTK